MWLVLDHTAAQLPLFLIEQCWRSVRWFGAGSNRERMSLVSDFGPTIDQFPLFLNGIDLCHASSGCLDNPPRFWYANRMISGIVAFSQTSVSPRTNA